MDPISFQVLKPMVQPRPKADKNKVQILDSDAGGGAVAKVDVMPNMIWESEQPITELTKRLREV